MFVIKLFERLMKSLPPPWQALICILIGLSLLGLGRAKAKEPRNLLNAIVLFAGGAGFMLLGLLVLIKK